MSKVNPELRARVEGLMQEGKLMREICNILGEPRHAVWSAIKSINADGLSRNGAEVRVKHVIELTGEGMTRKQVAEAIGVSPVYVKNTLQRARRRRGVPKRAYGPELIERNAKIMHMLTVEGLHQAEIARRLGCTVGTVCGVVDRARKRGKLERAKAKAANRAPTTPKSLWRNADPTLPAISALAEADALLARL